MHLLGDELGQRFDVVLVHPTRATSALAKKKTKSDDATARMVRRCQRRARASLPERQRERFASASVSHRAIAAIAKRPKKCGPRDGTQPALLPRMRSLPVVVGAFVGALTVCALSVARDAHASPTRHLVRVDVMEMVVGRTPRTRHFDLFVASDGSLAQTHAGLYTLGVRWSDRQEGRATMTFILERAGASPLHSTLRYHPTLGAPSLRYASGSKGMVTDVIVTVT
jgi:hypothetical protein